MTNKPKPIWVFEAGTYRSGTTTHYQMLRDVITRTNSGFGIGYHQEQGDKNRLRDFDALDYSNWNELNDIFNKHQVSHHWDRPPKFTKEQPYIACKVFEFIPDGFRGKVSHGQLLRKQKRIKAVVSIRNPLDIITSMKCRSGEDLGKVFPFAETAEEKLPGWLANVMKWADLGDGQVLVSRFEDFTAVDGKDELKNLVTEVNRIAKFLDIRMRQPLAKEIAADYTPEAIRKRKDAYWQQKHGGNPNLKEDDALPSIPALKFASSGQWETELTKSEAQMVREHNREFMERFGYS